MKNVLEYVLKTWYSIFDREYIGNKKMEVVKMDKDIITVFDIANFFRSKCKMTHKKIQKLIYYAYVQYIIEYNSINDVSRTLFNEQPEAWLHGPVFPSLYQKYKKYNWKEIPKILYPPRLESDIVNLLNSVWNKYGKYTADELEYMTHCEAPWIDSRKKLEYSNNFNEKISPESIYRFYILR